MGMLPKKRESISRRSIEVGHTYLQRGRLITRGLWVRVTPSNPVLKVVLAPPIIGVMIALLILMLVILGFILLAVVLLSALPKAEEDETGRD